MDQPAPKTLSYLCSKCVIQYLAVYERLALAARCPLLRPIHQKSPLTIDNLRLGSSYYFLNGFLHKFGVFNAETSQLELQIATVEVLDYVGLDMQDRYWGEDLDLEPSDVKLGLFPREKRRRPADGDQRLLNPKILEVVNQLQRNPHGHFMLRDLGSALGIQRPGIPEPEIGLPTSQEQLAFFQKFQPELLTFQHSRTLRGANARDAVRSHLAKVLSRNTLVKNLAIEFDAGVLTMPAGYKLRVQNLSLDSDKFLDPVAPILEVSAFKTLKIREIAQPQQSARHPLLRSFERLELGPTHNLDWNSYIESLPNTEIYIDDFQATPAQFGNVARRWVRENRQVGTRLSINTNWGSETIQEQLGRIRQELGGKWKEILKQKGTFVPRWVVCAFDDQREIKIYGQPDGYLAVIVMEVVESENALAK